MSRNKEIVCFCQDITKEDIIRAIDEGYDHIETLKRFTGVFMGPCQGKTCALNVISIFSQKCGKSLDKINVPTIRPPVVPVTLGALTCSENLDSNE